MKFWRRWMVAWFGPKTTFGHIELVGRLRARPYTGKHMQFARRGDFEAVFQGGSTREQGQRVLSQILRWGGYYSSPQVPGDPYATHVRAGTIELCQHIISVLQVEPEAMHEQSQRTDPRE